MQLTEYIDSVQQMIYLSKLFLGTIAVRVLFLPWILLAFSKSDPSLVHVLTTGA